ncbi:NAD(P)/FAD-dependent oxidoreductase [Patescibacteria group bacterium]
MKKNSLEKEIRDLLGDIATIVVVEEDKIMEYDLLVIGGGASGMIAAGRAAEKGAHVLLLEKNNKLGVKLLITGKGRCNITNEEFDSKKFVEKFGKQGNFLFSLLSRFGVQETIKFFESIGVTLKTERGNRVFPKSDKAEDVLNALINYLKENKVEVKLNAEVRDILFKGNNIKKVILRNGKKLAAKKYLIAVGGKSYSISGSSGDGYKWLNDLGHTIIKPRPALVPLLIKERIVKDLEGLSLKNVEIVVYQDDKKKDSKFGEAIFTRVGLSGPIILDMSKNIGELLKNGKVNIRIDFKPALQFDTLDVRIQRDFREQSNRLFKNSLNLLLPKKLIPVMIKLSEIDPNKRVNFITRDERRKLLHLLKGFELEVKRLDGFNKSIVTTGGVDLKEIDAKTMKSKIIDNLYLSGEVINLDGPTGGYNLQMCWSTGFVAGDNYNYSI